LSKSRLKKLREKNVRQYLAPSTEANVRLLVTRTGIKKEEVPVPSKDRYKIPLLEVVPEEEDSNLGDVLAGGEEGEETHDPDELRHHQTRVSSLLTISTPSDKSMRRAV
jgi:hypothetical protein